MEYLSIKEIQQESLVMMKEIHRFCQDNNIHYSLTAGTLIGALRHNGFIPWDDDIDVMMTRDNFDRFCKEFRHENYEVMVPGQNGYYLKFARVLDKEKTLIVDNTFPFSSRPTGLFIDVFPIDSCPEDLFETTAKNCTKFKLYSWEYRHSLHCIETFKSANTIKNKLISALKWLKHFCSMLSHKFSFKTLENQIQEESSFLRKLNSTPSDVYGGFAFAAFNYHNRYSKEWFEHYILKDFEDTKFYVINGYDGFLKMRYKDYMKIPPKEKQVPLDLFKVIWK